MQHQCSWSHVVDLIILDTPLIGYSYHFYSSKSLKINKQQERFITSVLNDTIREFKKYSLTTQRLRPLPLPFPFPFPFPLAFALADRQRF